MALADDPQPHWMGDPISVNRGTSFSWPLARSARRLIISGGFLEEASRHAAGSRYRKWAMARLVFWEQL